MTATPLSSRSAPTDGGLDVVSQGAGEASRRSQTRDLAANLVTAIFRLVKLSTLHSIDNQAMVRQVDESVALVHSWGQRTEHNVSILFAHGSVFVGGLLLRANRSVYEGALELGQILEKVGAAEIGIMRDVRAEDFYALASALADALRTAKPKRIDRPSAKIRLRSFNAAALGREGMIDQRLDPAAQVARTYASAVVIMRRFFEELRRGRYDLPQRVKRVAQRLVDLSTGETPAFLGVTAARNQNHDQAGRAVNAAILSLAMARQITSDMVMLSRVAMSALLYDAAKARLAGVAGNTAFSVIPELSEQQEAEAPAGTAVVLTALGRVNEPSVMRTVIDYEAHWVRRKSALGPLYRGLRQPSMQARIVAVARAFNDLLTPSPGLTPPSADEAIAALEKEATEAADRTALRLLIGALGIFPTGTLIELSTGEVAVVLETPAHPSLYSQPKVRIVLDASGAAKDRPVDVDLAQQPRRSREPLRHVRRIVATSDDATAASLRAMAMAQGPALSPDPPPVGASGIRAQELEPPSSNSSLVRTPNSRSPTVASQFTSNDPTPPSARALEMRARQTSARLPLDRAPSTPFDALTPGTREVSWDEQANLIEQENAIAADTSPRSEVWSEVERQPNIPPTADGTLARTPFVHLLIYMLDQRLTGTTTFQVPGGPSHAIYFLDGAPAKIRTGAMIAPLDRLILEQGLLDEATLRSTLLEVSKKQILHGRHLVMKGLLDRETVVNLLRLQIQRKVTHLFELPSETRYAYYEGHNFLSTYGGPEIIPCEPLAAIMAGIRVRASDALVDSTLARIAGRPLALHVDADLKRFQLQREELAVVDLLRARRMTVADLLEAGAAPDRVVRLTIYALALTRHLDLGSGRAPVGIHRDWTAAAEHPLPHVRDTPPVMRATIPAAPMPAAPPPPLRPTTKMPAAVVEQVVRSTTRMPRADLDMEGRTPPSTRSDGVPLVPGWRREAPPASRQTTKLPRASLTNEAGDASDEAAPSSRNHEPAPSSRNPGPPSSMEPGRPRVATKAYEWSTAGGSITPPSPGVVLTPQTPPISAERPIAPSITAPITPPVASPIAPPFSAERPIAPPVAASKPIAPPVAASKPIAPPLPADRPQVGASKPIAPPVGSPIAPPLPADRPIAPPVAASKPSTGPRSPIAPPLKPASSAADKPISAPMSPIAPPIAASKPSTGPTSPIAPPLKPASSAADKPISAPMSPIAPPIATSKPISAPMSPIAPPVAANKPSTGPTSPIAPPVKPSPPAADKPISAPMSPIAPPLRPPVRAADRPVSTPASPIAPPVSPAERPTVAPPKRQAKPPPPPSPAAAPPAVSSTPTPPSPAARPDLAARRAEIERRAQSIDSEDYFQMLGVPRDAASDQIRNAYFALARTFHPDRLPADLADLKPALGRVFARFNDAYQTLNDATRRKEYLETLQKGGGTTEDDAKIARVVDAALEFQKAEVLLKKNDLEGAEALAKRATEADPEQPEYLALLIWIRALRRGDPPGMKEGMTSGHFDDLIRLLDGVLAKEPRYERALYYRGVLQKRAGRADKAIRDFKLVAELNPKNLDAVREVRLHDMRRRGQPNQPPPEGGGGLFGKFFKR